MCLYSLARPTSLRNRLIKESVSLEIYRILSAFSFFLVHPLWHNSVGALRMLFSLFPLKQQDYIMARRRMHSLYIQWIPQWIAMKNSCFSVTKSAAFMHPRAWHSWTLGTSRGVLWTWNIFFYVSFFHYAPSVSRFLFFPPVVFLDSLVWPGFAICAVCGGDYVSFIVTVFMPPLFAHTLWVFVSVAYVSSRTHCVGFSWQLDRRSLATLLGTLLKSHSIHVFVSHSTRDFLFR